MATAPFAISGDDPLLSPDVVVNTDPSLASIPPDPFSDPLAFIDTSSAPPVYGPTLAQLGTDQTQIAQDPSAFNASPTTAAPSGVSIFDQILGVAKVATGIVAATQSRTGTITDPTIAANKASTAKTGSGFFSGPAGTSSGLLFAVILIFVGLFLWAELKH
jgi:hypothetical protein